MHVPHDVPSAHRFEVAERLAWNEGPGREPGEGVVVELLPPTHADRQPRYRLHVFEKGSDTKADIVLPEGVLFSVPRWEHQMPREEPLRYHGGQTPPWNEAILGD